MSKKYKTIATISTNFTTFIGEVVAFRKGRILIHWNKEISHFHTPSKILWENPVIDKKNLSHAPPNVKYHEIEVND